MDTKTNPAACVSAVIPAYNEAATIGDVIRSVERHPLIDEVIVVNDGSADETVERARVTSARVISLPQNRGKATAMAHGVAAARNEIIFFLDADIHGLSHQGITSLIEPVRSGRTGMFVAIRDRRVILLNRLLRFTPILGGERVLSKSLWNAVPDGCKKKFQIEIALNYYAKHLGYGMDFATIPGLNHVKKEKKHGLFRGFYERLRMFADILAISARIYLLRDDFQPAESKEARPADES